MLVKLSQFYTVYYKCPATSVATHLSCNKLSNSRNTSWGTLKKFRHTRECCDIQVRTLSLQASYTAQKQGQLQHYPDVSLYHNKDQLKTTQRIKPQTQLLSRVRKQCTQYCSKTINSMTAQAQVNQHSILGKYLSYHGWIWPVNIIWIYCAVRETLNYTITSSRQKSRWCL